MCVRALPIQLLLLVCLHGALGGCGSPALQSTKHPASTATSPVPGKITVRALVEPSGVQQIAAARGSLLVGTGEGLLRWSDDGKLTVTEPTTSLSGPVLALASDEKDQSAWIVTTTGVGRYDAKSESTNDIQAPTAIGLALESLRGTFVTASAGAEGGLWLGTVRGLFFVSRDGGWASTTIKDAVTNVSAASNGEVWAATSKGIFWRKPGGGFGSVAPASMCGIVRTIQITIAEHWSAVIKGKPSMVAVVGEVAKGQVQLGLRRGNVWACYEMLHPDKNTAIKVAQMIDGEGELLVIIDDALWRIRNSNDPLLPVARDNQPRLVRKDESDADLRIEPITLALPKGLTTLSRWGNSIAIGTSALGVAQTDLAVSRVARWLRRGQMFSAASTLSVACVARDDCWIATGAKSAWHQLGSKLTADGPNDVVLAVVRGPQNDVYAFHRSTAERSLHVSMVAGDGWTEVPALRIDIPGGPPEVSFCRFDAKGKLWVGLRYRAGEEVLSFGVAVLDINRSLVEYHRSTTDPKLRKAMMPIPIGVMDGDLSSDNAAWFATSEGVARMAGSSIELWSERNGLVSEFAKAIAVTSTGTVMVATSSGLGIFAPTNKVWDFPKSLQFVVNDVMTDGSGQAWLATERGVANWDGSKVKRLDQRAGMVENQVLDLVGDQFGRIWARGPMSLTVIDTGQR
jgi:hypothetical protein